MPDEIIITATMLRHLTICNRRVWLDHHGDPDLRTADALALAHGRDHEAAVQAAAQPDRIRALPVEGTWDELVTWTRGAMADQVHLIIDAPLEAVVTISGVTVRLRGRADRLVRRQWYGEDGRTYYAPIEIKSYSQARPADLLQLRAYLWLLEETQGEATAGQLWLGRDLYDQPIRKQTVQPDHDEVRAALATAVAILMDAEPPIWLASHCETCHWRGHCEAQAHTTKAITLLPNLPRESWVQLHEIGVTTLHQIADATPESLRAIRKIGKMRSEKFPQAARAFLSGEPVWSQPLEAASRRPGLCLDIETEWDINKPWSFGFTDPDGVLTTLVVGRGESPLTLPNGIRVDLVRNAIEAWAWIADKAGDAPIYHWGGYDHAVMRATASAAVRERIDGQMIDLNRVWRRTVIAPITSTSMKTVAPYLGCPYPDATDAMLAWRLYQQWRLDRQPAGLAQACGYLRADVIGLARAWAWLNEGTP